MTVPDPSDGLDPAGVGPAAAGTAEAGGAADGEITGEPVNRPAPPAPPGPPVAEGPIPGLDPTLASLGSAVHDAADAVALAESRLADLQRERAEFVNFRRRSERDVGAARAAGVAQLVEALLPVLDDIGLAREHGDLDGTPFAPISDKLMAILEHFGLEVYGAPGDPFDPLVHEALLHEAMPAELAGATAAVCSRVLQPGYRLGERVLRPARVAVADPD